jgi:hypothetical protein
LIRTYPGRAPRTGLIPEQRRALQRGAGRCGGAAAAVWREGMVSDGMGGRGGGSGQCYNSS